MKMDTVLAECDKKTGEMESGGVSPEMKNILYLNKELPGDATKDKKHRRSGLMKKMKFRRVRNGFRNILRRCFPCCGLKTREGKVRERVEAHFSFEEFCAAREDFCSVDFAETGSTESSDSGRKDKWYSSIDKISSF